MPEIIHHKFKKLKEILDTDPLIKERREQKKFRYEEMEEIVERLSHIEELEKPVIYIKNGLGNWYTCLLDPGMELCMGEWGKQILFHIFYS